MITSSIERLQHAFKNARVVVRNSGSFPVHQFRGTHNLAAENFADALVTEANAEHRNVRPEFANDVATNSRVARPARSGRDTNSFRNKLSNVCRADLIVAFNHNFAARITENLRESIGQRTIIIDY